ncbi:hypothetical protein C4D60_Mb10t18970 [Musa balbisiana]|uniref:Uncharacterized protein n=1 Tax=Musa balbisiana TaxID=52838 RepID=A0A4S8J0P8_MUSBA|nr:hypothetical protein C4D60_Mb10t18970 [Musa balbisiana]
MVNLRSMRMGRASSVSSLRPPTESRIGSKDAPVEVEASWPRKKVKVCVTKGSDAATAQSGGVTTEPADHVGSSLGRGEAGPSREGAGKAPREPSIRELCRLPVGTKDEPFQVHAMGDLPEGEAFDPLVARWGAYPAGQHYAMVLMDRVRDAGRVIGNLSNHNTELRRQIKEIRARVAPKAVTAAEQCASDLEAEATHLKSELKVAEEENKELQVHLRVTRAEVRLAKGETLALNQKLDEARAETCTTSKVLAVEICQWPEKDKKLIEAYKKSPGFELGLTRTGQASSDTGDGSVGAPLGDDKPRSLNNRQ